MFTGARNFAASFLLPRLARRRTSRSALFRLVSQLGVRYTDSSVVAEDMTNADGDFRRAPGKGARAPDGPLWLLPAGEPTTLHARLTGGAHHLLLFARTGETGLLLIESVKRRLPIPYRSLLRTHLVIGEAIGELARWPPLISVYQDQSGITLRRYGITSAGIYLVRPDGYVAFRAPGLGAVEGFVSYLEAVLKRPSSRAVPIHQSRAPDLRSAAQHLGRGGVEGEATFSNADQNGIFGDHRLCPTLQRPQFAAVRKADPGAHPVKPGAIEDDVGTHLADPDVDGARAVGRERVENISAGTVRNDVG